MIFSGSCWLSISVQETVFGLMCLALVGWGWQPSQHGVMGILGLWHLACPDAVCREATAELMLWLQLQSRRRPAHSLCRVQHILHTKPVCWEKCAKHCLGLLLGLVLYQRKINRFKTDLAAFMKTTHFLLRKQQSVGLVVKEKCGSGMSVFPLYEGNYEGVGCLEMWKHVRLPAPASLGSLQSLWPTLKEKLGPYL